jgi:hypothetical protein
LRDPSNRDATADHTFWEAVSAVVLASTAVFVARVEAFIVDKSIVGHAVAVVVEAVAQLFGRGVAIADDTIGPRTQFAPRAAAELVIVRAVGTKRESFIDQTVAVIIEPVAALLDRVQRIAVRPTPLWVTRLDSHTARVQCFVGADARSAFSSRLRGA